MGLLVVPLLLVARAEAQGFDAQRYVPPAGAAGGLLVERAAVPAHLGWSLGLFGSYADDPVVVSDPDTGEILSRPVDALVGVDLLASLGLFDRLELAVDLPIVALSTGDALSLGGQTLAAAPGLGDLRILPKGVLVRTDGAASFVLGLGVPITLPTGDEAELRGAGEASVAPELLMGVLGARTAFHGSAGVRLRPGLDAVDPIGNELTLGAALAWSAIERKDVLDLLVEADAALDLSRPGPALTDLPLELLAGLAWKPGKGWTLTGAGGPGLTDGLGTPDFRVVAGVRYAPRPAGSFKDSDGDGTGDPHDRCPNRAEDYDGFQDGDGCPESDNDGDRVPDDVDECPEIAEERGGDGDGCPDRGRVRVTRSGKVEVVGKVLFASGSEEIDPRSAQLLDEIAREMKEHPELEHVEIQGYTDDVGEEAMNEELSRRRAESVKRALVERGVAEGRLTTKGFGERKPIAPNDTPAGRARNRRVEFVVKEQP